MIDLPTDSAGQRAGAAGYLYTHSGIVPGADPSAGAALNGMQIRRLAAVFDDGFESGNTSGWDATGP